MQNREVEILSTGGFVPECVCMLGCLFFGVSEGLCLLPESREPSERNSQSGGRFSSAKPEALLAIRCRLGFPFYPALHTHTHTPLAPLAIRERAIKSCANHSTRDWHAKRNVSCKVATTTQQRAAPNNKSVQSSCLPGWDPVAIKIAHISSATSKDLFCVLSLLFRRIGQKI